jgi:DNA repair exonuclease SbcCD ATPase subunit
MSVGAVPIEFEYTTGIHRVTGEVLGENIKNGVGKSLIFLDAIIFALYGKSIRGLNLNQMINSINEKECEIVLWLDINDVPYRIERGLNPDYINFINENENDDENTSKKVSKNSKKLEKNNIVNTIKISFETMVNILTMNPNYSLPFFKLNPAIKRQLIQDFSNTTVYGTMFDIIKKQYNEFKTDKKVLASELKNSQENYEEKINTFNKLESLKKEFDIKKQKDIDSINEQILITETSLIKLESKKPKEDYNSIKTKIINKKDEIKTKLYSLNSDISSFEKDILKNKNKIKNIEINPICPQCGSPNDGEHVKLEIDKLISENIEYNEKIISNKQEKEILNNFLSELNIKETKINEVLNKISNIESSIISNKQNLETLKEKLNEKTNSTFDSGNLITEKDVQNYKTKLDLKTSEYNENEKQMLYYDYLKELFGDGGIKTHIIKKVVPFLNKKMNEYLSLFNANYSISFDNELNETLKSRKRDIFSYNNFSSGEQKKIDLSMMFSLLSLAKSQNAIECNILVLDEILDSALCNKATQQLMDYLKNDFKKDHPNLCTYIISHKSDINNDNFDSVVHLIKENNFTKIKEIETIEKSLY